MGIERIIKGCTCSYNYKLAWLHATNEYYYCTQVFPHRKIVDGSIINLMEHHKIDTTHTNGYVRFQKIIILFACILYTSVVKVLCLHFSYCCCYCIAFVLILVLVINC